MINYFFVDLHFFEKARFIIGSLSLAVILFLAVFLGANAGKTQAQARVILQTSQNLADALRNFYSDQNRYPNASEFQSQNIMLAYLTQFPLPEFVSKGCSRSFVYKKISAEDFQLNFCLPSAVGGYPKGWSSFNAQTGAAQ